METLIRLPARLLAATLALGLATGALADGPNIKPGLWEMQMDKGPGGAPAPDMAKMQEAMKKMQSQMAQMPPEQRRMMEEHFGDMSARFSATGIRTCMTPDDIKREEIPMNDNNCKTTIKTRSSSRWVASSVCTKPQMTGEAEAIFESPTAYTVNVKGTVTENGQQKPYNMSMKMKFISSDCGAVKSFSELKPPRKTK